MFCPKCGAQNADGANFCQTCGGVLAPTIAQPQATSVAARRTSGQAVASLVLGIMGLFVGITSVLAIIFGGIAMHQTGKDPGLTGHGLAVAGLVTGIIGLGFWLLVGMAVVLDAIGSLGA